MSVRSPTPASCSAYDRMRIQRWTILAMVLAWVTALPAQAERLRFGSIEGGQQEVGFSVGYGANHRIPEATKERFSFDTAKVRLGRFTSPRNELLLEFSWGVKDTAEGTSAVWTTGTYKHYFLVRGSTAASWDISIGLLRMSDAVSSQGTRTNFTEQLGLTAYYATGPASAISLEYKFSHISNAGIRLPNLGINTSILTLGYSWYP